MEEKVRRTAIDVVGDVPWGTHFCQFYQTKEDLVDILVPYFRAGLKDNEFCMWVTSEPLNVEDAKGALKKKVKDLDDYIKKGQIEILDYTQWYAKGGHFDSDKVLQGWVEKEKQALEKGFEGLRLTGNTFWLEEEDWEDFTNYEAAVNSVIGKYRMLAVCTYCFDKCTASEIIDVVSNHQFALIKRKGKWEIIESAEHKKTVEAMQESEQKYRAIFEQAADSIVLIDGQTGELVDFNDKAFENLGYTRAEFGGLKIEDFEITESAKEVGKHIKKIVRGGAETFETKHRTKSGEIRDILVSSRVISISGRDFVQSIWRDITERKRAEEALKLHDLRLKALLDLNKMIEASEQEILDFVREEAVSITKSKFAFIGFMNEDESVQTTYAWSKEVMRQCAIVETARQFSVAEAGLWGEAVRQRRPIIINDYAAPHPQKKGYPKGHVPIKRFLCVPVFDGERIVMVAAVANKEKDYEQSDVRAITSMMNDTLRLIRRKRAEEDLKKYKQHLEELVEARTKELTEVIKLLRQEIKQRKQLERAILDISEREQRRIGRELHDSIGQQFTGIAFMTKVLEQKLATKLPEEAARVEEIGKLVNQAMDQTRGLVKVLEPVTLDAGSLMLALQELALTTENLFGVRCTFKCDKPGPIDDAEVAVHLYRITQEAVTNAIKHGRAKNIHIGLTCGKKESVLTVKNDGVNFPKEFEKRGTGMGLQIMDHRVDIIGGSLNIHRAPKGGTIVTCTFPNKNTHNNLGKNYGSEKTAE